jgi:hypothetical protein
MNLGADRNKKALHRHATRFLGYGDPEHAKIWFVGIEDVTQLKNLEELRRLPTQPYLCRSVGHDKTPSVYTIISKVVTCLKGDSQQNGWRSYRTQDLFKAKSDAFLANLYPLGKRVEEEWPETYQKWLGMTRDEYYRWLQYDNLQRFTFLRMSRLNYHEPLTICFGKNHWHHFARCFAVDRESCIAIDRFQFIQSRNLVMTEFFRSTRMSDASIARLAALINELDMNPFRPNRKGRRKGRIGVSLK